MARADTKTWLPIDRWAEIMGQDPLHFNGVYTALRPQRSGCDDFWAQFDWQDTQHVSRESLAIAIRDAERQIAQYVGYNLLPDWTTDERHNTVRPADRTLYSGGLSNIWGRRAYSAVNVRGQAKSIKTRKGHIISGGVKTKAVIEAAAAITRSDADGDGYSELCTVTVATTITDLDEIRVYFAGKSGADAWEIRPLTSVSADGTNATITFKIWQVVDPDNVQGLDVSWVDGDTAGNFETTVDVYRVYNNPATQVQFMWEPFPTCACTTGQTCTVCQHSTQYGCLRARDYRRGSFTYEPADYDSDDEEWDATAYVIARDPDRLRLWYYSGWKDEELARPYTILDSKWERCIAYYAVALLDRELCECDNLQVFYNYWRDDLAKTNTNRSYVLSPSDLANPFGTTRAGMYVWKRVNEPGIKLPN